METLSGCSASTSMKVVKKRAVKESAFNRTTLVKAFKANTEERRVRAEREEGVKVEAKEVRQCEGDPTTEEPFLYIPGIY